jgi:hypothetical protein
LQREIERDAGKSRSPDLSTALSAEIYDDVSMIQKEAAGWKANGEAQRRQTTSRTPPRSCFRPLQRSVSWLATGVT